MRSSLTVAVMSFIVLLSFAAAYSAEPASEPVIKRDIPYVKEGHERQVLDVYSPAEGEKRPIVFWIHGGGWQVGDKADVQIKPSALVARGHVFVSTNYRLLPTVPIDEMAADIAQAIRWVHDHADEHRGDPQRIVIGGHSAGAQLAALLCTDERYLKQVGLSFAVVRGCLPVDGDTYDVPLQIATVEQRRKDIYGRKFGDLEQQKNLSPIHHVARDKSIPPFLILHVAGHPEVTLQAERLVARLKEAKVDAAAYAAAGKNHNSINADLGQADDKPTAAVYEFLDRVLK